MGVVKGKRGLKVKDFYVNFRHPSFSSLKLLPPCIFVSKHAPPLWERRLAAMVEAESLSHRVESSGNEGVLNVNYFCAFLKDAKKSQII